MKNKLYDTEFTYEHWTHNNIFQLPAINNIYDIKNNTQIKTNIFKFNKIVHNTQRLVHYKGHAWTNLIV